MFPAGQPETLLGPGCMLYPKSVSIPCFMARLYALPAKLYAPRSLRQAVVFRPCWRCRRALLIQRGWAVTLAICLLVTTWHDLAAWRHASRITEDFLAEIETQAPQPPTGAEFVLHNMPRWAEGGVYLLLHRALADSLRLVYGRDDIRARREDEPALSSARSRIDIYWVGDWQGRYRPLITRRDAAPHER